MNLKKLLILVGILLLVTSFFASGAHQYFTFEGLKENQTWLMAFVEREYQFAISLYIGIYIFVAALSLPGAAVLTLAGGAFFGLFWGTVATSIASTVGATLAFLVSRFLFHDEMHKRFGHRLRGVNERFKREGGFYLFTLRLVPMFPFFLVNILMAFTPVRTPTFFWVSMLGMLPGTFVYVNAGAQLSEIETLSGILSPSLIGAFALLGIFPWVAKAFVEAVKRYMALRKFKKPAKFTHNLIVIGAGAGGLVSAYIAAQVKAKVALIEKHKMGGDCLNTGCVPSKALLKSAKIVSYTKRAHEFGLRGLKADFDFGGVMKRVHRVIEQIEPHDSVERYSKLGVNCVEGEAKILSPYEVQVGDKKLTARNIIVATGARPFVPPIKGLEKKDTLTSDTVWGLKTKPRRLLVLGGGAIGCELAQAFNRLGVQVTQAEGMERFLPKEDKEVGEYVRARLEQEGVEVITGHMAVRVSGEGADKKMVLQAPNGSEKRVPFDKVLVAVGRKANTTGFGLEQLGVNLNDNGTIAVDEYMRTNIPTIFACGDVAGPYQFTHMASHQAWYAAVNALFGFIKKFKVDYKTVAWCTYTDPEIARVGLSEDEAKQQCIPYEVTTYGLDDLDRAITEEEAQGFVKVLTVPEKDIILGATIVGAHAGEMISEFVIAMKHGLGLNKLLGTLHIYPTHMEGIRFVAGNWKKAKKPQQTLAWLKKLHSFMRG